MKKLISQILFVVLLLGSNQLRAEETVTPVLDPEQLENYQFEPREDEEPTIVKALNVGQRYILNSQRREILDLVTRRLGVLTLKQNKQDLKVIQQLVDKKLIRKSNVREWQALGVIFGDILVTEFGLQWVSYEDDRGASKALRWRESENYVFPVTVFSKRVQFNEDIDAQAIYEKIEESIISFKRFESLRPR